MQGILDSQFAEVQALQDSSNPNFVNEVITLFCNNAERIITEMNTSHANVDFSLLNSCVYQLKGNCLRFRFPGAAREGYFRRGGQPTKTVTGRYPELVLDQPIFFEPDLLKFQDI
ncbi:hypothetical protein QYF36_016796 [Acer negundo]|nr:hypothetical protein QYF36_016796 [Acer negundo]